MLIFLVLLIFSVILHEVAHGFVADRLGDPTARLAGRLTLNPIPHIDPIGTILLPLFLILTHAGILFGWAKPVPFDPFNLKNPRRDSAIISLAGPATNLSIAILSSLIIRVILGTHASGISFLIPILVGLLQINIVLGVFNLLPVAPLDGFKVVGGLLSDEQARNWYGLERYGMIFLLALIFPLLPGGGSMLNALLGPAVDFVSGLLLPSGMIGTI